MEKNMAQQGFIGRLSGAQSKSRLERDYKYLDHESYRNKLRTDKEGHSELSLFIEGIHCANCLHRIESLKEAIPEVKELRVNLGDHSALLTIKPTGSFSKIVQAIQDLGFVPHPEGQTLGGHISIESENRKLLMRLGVAGAATANIMLLVISIYAGAEAELAKIFHVLSFLLFLPVFFYSAQPFFKNTWLAIKNRSPSIDLPIAIALSLGGGISTWHLVRGHGDIYYDSLSSLVFLLLGSRYLLARTHQKYLSPSFWKPFLESKTVRRLNSNSGVAEDLTPDELKIGDIVQVFEGEKIPVDGKLIEERGYVNVSILTGETRPQKILRGEACFAGTECSSPSLTFITTAVGDQTRIGQILAKMENEFFSRTPLTALADRAAQIFTVSVLLIGSLFFLYYASIDFHEAVNRTLALVVLACPCALAFATPLAQSLSLQTALRRGYLIKRAESLEKLAKVEEVVFDKTGTLTEGEFELLNWYPSQPRSEILAAIYALEAKCDHPIAKAFTQELDSYRNSAPTLVDFSEQIGKGISGKFSDGSQLNIFKSNEDLADQSSANILLNAVDVVWNGNLQATVLFGDRLRSDAAFTLDAIKKMGLRFFVLTGDKAAPALLAAHKLRLDPIHILTQQSPEQKNTFIKSRKHVAMVGDGANDAVAMASSYVGIAVKGSMEASLQAADVYLTRSGVSPVLDVLSIARKSMQVVRRNLVLSMIYNLACGTAALMGHISPLLAAILMPLNSMIVVSSSIIGTSGFRPTGDLLKSKSNAGPDQGTGHFNEIIA
jgi:Cu2+-exporting ATPase/Cu+-exporting ATPase